MVSSEQSVRSAAQYPFGLAAAGEDDDCVNHLQSRCSCLEVEHDRPSSNDRAAVGRFRALALLRRPGCAKCWVHCTRVNARRKKGHCAVLGHGVWGDRREEREQGDERRNRSVWHGQAPCTVGALDTAAHTVGRRAIAQTGSVWQLERTVGMLLAQCAVSLLSHGSDRRHAASSVLDAKGDDLRSSGRPDVAVTPKRMITLFTDGISHETGRIVYIIGGQSQASGKGLTNELTDEERDRAAALGRRVVVEYPKLDIEPEQLTELKDALKKDYMSNSAPQNDPRVGRTAKIASRIHDDPRIKPGSSTLGEIASGSQGGTFGPEVSFGLRVAEAMPFRNITIIKVSWPGVDMSTYVRTLYPEVLSSLKRFGEAHGKFELGGMLWLHGEFDAGFNEPDFLSTRATVSLATRTPAAQNPTALSPTMHAPMAAWQYPAAANYSHQLKSLVRNLRADTGLQVPFAAALMRIFHASWSKDHPPHNVRVVNDGIRAAASALEKMYVVDGYSRKLPRYFDEPQHCVPSDVQARMGSLWTDAFANLCRRPTSLKGSGCKNDARWDTAMGVSACLPQHDWHFTARGQIGVGHAFAEKLLSDQGSKSSGAKASPSEALLGRAGAEGEAGG